MSWPGDDSIAPLTCNVRDRRLAAGLSQRELAKAAGVGVGLVRNLERGVTLRPRRRSLERLAEALGIDAREAAALIPAPLVGGLVNSAAEAAASPDVSAHHMSAAPPPRTEPSEQESVRCRILGPLEIWGPDGVVRLGGPRQQAVLGLLAMHANASLGRAMIIDALWGEEPPASAATMIHSYVSQLRKLLPSGWHGDEPLLSTTSNGYRLWLRGDELDLTVFKKLAGYAREARAAGDTARTAGLLEQALGLWRGEPLADVGLLKDHPAVTELRAMRTAAVIDYAETATTQAEHDKAVPHLRALAAREPLNERAHACLMTALTTIGQQAAALETFEHVRQRLDDELGVRPGTDLTEAHMRVLRGTIPAARRPATDQPAGYEMSPPCQLPAAVSDFTGRIAEIIRLTEILAPSDNAGVPVAAICGLPGAGKTALALRVAHQLRPHFPDGQLWVQLDGASARPRYPADVLDEILRTLGVHGAAIPDTLAQKAAMYRSRLADRKILLVADDASSAEQIRPLIPGTAGSAVVVTSRMQLAELHGARIMPLDVLGAKDAIGLLARIVGQERVSAEPADAEQLVSACGRLPLAVRIAGAKLAARPAWPVSLMSEAIADEQRRLDELKVGSLSVRASLSMSYQALDDNSQRALCFLGMLGPTDVAEWVIAALLGVTDPSDVVNRLADSSLLTPIGVDATGFPRYRLHDLLRDYAVERLAEEHESNRADALARALGAWLQLACLADSRLPREPYFPPPTDGDAPGFVPAIVARRLTADPIAWFTAERLNLLHAIEHSCATGNHRLATRLASRIAAYQHIQSRPDDTGRIWHIILSAAQEADDSAAAADAELRLAATMCGRGRHAEAVASIDRCIQAFEERGDHRSLAAAVYWRAVCDLDLGSISDARHGARRALDLSRELGDRQLQFLTLRIVSLAQAIIPEYDDDTISSCEEALAIVREFGEPTWELEVMHAVAHASNLTGRHKAAADMYLEALELHRKLGVVIDKAGWLGVMGDAHQGLGRYREAVEALSTALPIFRDNFQHRHQALCLLKLGYAYQAISEYGQAIASVEESLPIFRELRLTHYEEQALKTIESCRLRQQPNDVPSPRSALNALRAPHRRRSAATS